MYLIRRILIINHRRAARLLRAYGHIVNSYIDYLDMLAAEVGRSRSARTNFMFWNQYPVRIKPRRFSTQHTLFIDYESNSAIESMAV
ncbi:MAG: hypothetical protein GWO23_05045 [Gammaproteobacteria bacterium]|nr:hypothetical protein [Gammaproteobacteria bacterium]NIW44489.1 hypothetical protein [Gammaproteobacteria bacterium]